jgi:hypothetical protein
MINTMATLFLTYKLSFENMAPLAHCPFLTGREGHRAFQRDRGVYAGKKDHSMKSVSTVETLNVEEVQKCKNMGEKCMSTSFDKII